MSVYRLTIDEKTMENIGQTPKRRVSIPEAREMAKRGVSLIWRPIETLPEEEQYAEVCYDPEEN
jgi:hypothetical protein